MTNKFKASVLFIGAMFLIATVFYSIVEARGGGGRGGGGGARRRRRFLAKQRRQWRRLLVPFRVTIDCRPCRNLGTHFAIIGRSFVGLRSPGTATGSLRRTSGKSRRCPRRLAGSTVMKTGKTGRITERDMQDDRQDFYEDEYHGGHWDNDWYDGDDEAAAFVVGAAVGVAAGAAAASSHTTYVNTVTTLPCSSTMVTVNGTSYYQCGTTWYSRGYQGNSVVYIVTIPPAGY
jgi:hypothetical protein